MKTSPVQPAEFAAKFGTDKIKPGPFEYFSTDIGVGIIKNTEFNTIETVAGPDIDPEDITPEDELVMMSLVCGNYKEEPAVIPPTLRDVKDYQYDEKQTSWKFNKMWLALGGIVTLALVVYVYVFYGK
jgi:hypothetical protein